MKFETSRLPAFMLALVVALPVGSCAGAKKAEAKDTAAADVPTVAVDKAKVERISRELALTAEFRPYQEIDVMAKVAGYVKSINVDIGDRVKQGQLIATLEIPEMADDQVRAKSLLSRSQSEVARAKDELQRAESSHDIAHLSYTRLSDVSKKKAGLVAQQEIDDAHSRDLVAEAQVNAAKSNLASMEQQVQVSTSELAKTETLLGYTRVTAPFDGVVTRRYADLGSMIQAGTSSSTQVMPIVKLSQNDLLRLSLPVPESAVPSVHIGQEVQVRVPALNRSFRGKVQRLGEKISSATRTMETEVEVQNSDMILIPGMYAEVILTLNSPHAALTIPITSVDLGSDESSGKVVVVTPENRVEFRTVQLGLQTATSFEVKSGLDEGHLVVTGNRSALHAGEEVRPKMIETTAPPVR
jgi:RND family efflux transporter MFP subunit